MDLMPFCNGRNLDLALHDPTDVEGRFPYQRQTGVREWREKGCHSHPVVTTTEKVPRLSCILMVGCWMKFDS